MSRNKIFHTEYNMFHKRKFSQKVQRCCFEVYKSYSYRIALKIYSQKNPVSYFHPRTFQQTYKNFHTFSNTSIIPNDTKTSPDQSSTKTNTSEKIKPSHRLSA